MDTELVSLQIPARLFDRIKELAEQENTDPVEVVNQLITMAHQRRAWLNDLSTLRDQVDQDGVVNASLSGQRIVKKMREIRREIFEAEYAHLYR